MKKNSSLTSRQIITAILICLAMALIYFALAYFFGRKIANTVLMWGLIAVLVIVIIVRVAKGKI